MSSNPSMTENGAIDLKQKANAFNIIAEAKMTAMVHMARQMRPNSFKDDPEALEDHLKRLVGHCVAKAFKLNSSLEDKKRDI